MRAPMQNSSQMMLSFFFLFVVDAPLIPIAWWLEMVLWATCDRCPSKIEAPHELSADVLSALLLNSRVIWLTKTTTQELMVLQEKKKTQYNQLK